MLIFQYLDGCLQGWTGTKYIYLSTVVAYIFEVRNLSIIIIII